MQYRLGVKLIAAGLGLASSMADAELFRHANEPKPLAIQITDDVYVGRGPPGSRIAVDGRHRIARIVPGADKTLIRFDFDYATEHGFIDELQHGLVKPQQLQQTGQLAYDRTTGLIVFQKIIRAADPTEDPRRQATALKNSTDAFLIAQPTDPAILEFLDAVMDHLPALDQFYQKRSDCGAAEAARNLLPLQHLGAALPADHVLYARNLGLAAGCGVAWQQMQFAFNTIFELVDPLNPGSGGYRPDYTYPAMKEKTTPVLPNSRVGDLEDAIRAKMIVIAQSNEFHPINYDLAASVREFELAPHGEALQVKKRQELNLNEDAEVGHSASHKPDFAYAKVPTLLNIEDVLVELRSEKFKQYQRPAPTAGSP